VLSVQLVLEGEKRHFDNGFNKYLLATIEQWVQWVPFLTWNSKRKNFNTYLEERPWFISCPTDTSANVNFF